MLLLGWYRADTIGLELTVSLYFCLTLLEVLFPTHRCFHLLFYNECFLFVGWDGLGGESFQNVLFFLAVEKDMPSVCDLFFLSAIYNFVLVSHMPWLGWNIKCLLFSQKWFTDYFLHPWLCFRAYRRLFVATKLWLNSILEWGLSHFWN